MNCPLCGGDFDEVDFVTVSNQKVVAEQCDQCGGFWFNRPINEPLDYTLLKTYDTPKKSYSLRADDLFCPIDQALMTLGNDQTMTPRSVMAWHCPDCAGEFFPKGQLALYTQWQLEDSPSLLVKSQENRTKSTTIVALIGLLFIGVVGSLNRYNLLFNASTGTPLPNSGSNIVTLALLSVAYIAGTVLAVLGRKLPLIIIGWGVIVACMFGFVLVIFGP